jgi:hypothetical protein
MIILLHFKFKVFNIKNSWVSIEFLHNPKRRKGKRKRRGQRRGQVITITHLLLLITPLTAGCDTPKTLAIRC